MFKIYNITSQKVESRIYWQNLQRYHSFFHPFPFNVKRTFVSPQSLLCCKSQLSPTKLNVAISILKHLKTMSSSLSFEGFIYPKHTLKVWWNLFQVLRRLEISRISKSFIADKILDAEILQNKVVQSLDFSHIEEIPMAGDIVWIQ